MVMFYLWPGRVATSEFSMSSRKETWCIVNYTGKTYELKRGCLLGKLGSVAETNVVSAVDGMKYEHEYQKIIEELIINKQ